MRLALAILLPALALLAACGRPPKPPPDPNRAAQAWVREIGGDAALEALLQSEAAEKGPAEVAALLQDKGFTCEESLCLLYLLHPATPAEEADLIARALVVALPDGEEGSAAEALAVTRFVVPLVKVPDTGTL